MIREIISSKINLKLKKYRYYMSCVDTMRYDSVADIMENSVM